MEQGPLWQRSLGIREFEQLLGVLGSESVVAYRAGGQDMVKPIKGNRSAISTI